MKSLPAILVGLAIVTFSGPATAHLVGVATSIPVTSTRDDVQFKQAVAAAVDDVLDRAIRFAPAVVSVYDARVVGDRLYILLLIADDDGVQMLKTLSIREHVLRDPPVEEPGGDATQ